MRKNRRNFIIFLFLALALIAIGIGVYITQITTRVGIKATAVPTLSFSPSTVTPGVGQQFTTDIMLDPATKQIQTVNIVLVYDSSKLLLNPTDIVRNSDAFPIVQTGPDFSPANCNTQPQPDCKMTYSLNIGSDQTKVISTPTKVATLAFTAQVAGDTTVAFDSNTSAADITTPDQNAIQSTSPLTVKAGAGGIANPPPGCRYEYSLCPRLVCPIGQACPTCVPQPTLVCLSGTPSPTPTVPACQPDVATCTWDKSNDPNVDLYHVKVEDVTASNVVQETDVPNNTNSFSFQIKLGDLFRCTVTAKNLKCGSSEPAVGSNRCIAPTPTQTPTPTNTPTPTPTPSDTPTPGPTPVNLPPVCRGLNVDRSTTGSAPYAITFTGIGSDPDGTIQKAVFNFGDGPTQTVTTGGGIGTNSVSIQIAHNFQNPGNYQASVYFVDDKNAQSPAVGSCAQAIVITVPPTSPPQPPGQPPQQPQPTKIVVVRPSLAPTGPGETFIGIGIVGTALSVIGALMIFGL